MTPNCRVTYVRMDTGESWQEEFHDPYIYRNGNRVVRWDGERYVLGVSYAGEGILERLQPVDLNRPPPAHPK